jgi:hypothetical protein
MTASKWICAALLGGALLAVSPSAWADPTPQEKEHARDLMADGREKRDKNDLAGALESFKQADAIMHVPTTGYEVAKTQQALGKLVEARETVDAIAKLPVSPNDPAPFAEARSKAEALGKELDAKLGRVRIKPTTPGATVKLDDAPAAVDTPLNVMPGKHVVSDGESRVDVSVTAGETKDVTVGAAKPPPAAVATNEPAAMPPPSTSKIPTLSLIGFGVGAAGLVVGSVTGIMAISAESDLSKECGDAKKCKPALQDDLDSAKTKATISTVGFIVAGVGVAVGIVGFFVQPKTEAKVGAVTFDFAKMRGTF